MSIANTFHTVQKMPFTIYSLGLRTESICVCVCVCACVPHYVSDLITVKFWQDWLVLIFIITDLLYFFAETSVNICKTNLVQPHPDIYQGTQDSNYHRPTY